MACDVADFPNLHIALYIIRHTQQLCEPWQMRRHIRFSFLLLDTIVLHDLCPLEITSSISSS